jgi:hypothetical protein
MPPEHAGFLVPGVSECAAAHSILQGSPLRCSIHILGSRLQEGGGVGVVPPAHHRSCSTQTAGECRSVVSGRAAPSSTGGVPISGCRKAFKGSQQAHRQHASATQAGRRLAARSSHAGQRSTHPLLPPCRPGGAGAVRAGPRDHPQPQTSPPAASPSPPLQGSGVINGIGCVNQ